MKTGSKVVLTLLAVALALPIQGFAEDKAIEAPKPATAATKPVIAAPTDCVVTGKNTANAVTGNAISEKRKQIHAGKGLKSGEEKLVVHNREAAHEHGRQQ